ncbi:hypothetical protein [Tellurirhabdus rosea]|uniref:hypothetical protein n=1 Tax=Tellurirhabdus rosea TaxID=2674997 RepID=UPI002250329D|nr:hypothetical protein [Tellurirhabdus rosea]
MADILQVSPNIQIPLWQKYNIPQGVNQVVAAANGNTGITGTGVPKSGGTAYQWAGLIGGLITTAAGVIGGVRGVPQTQQAPAPVDTGTGGTGGNGGGMFDNNTLLLIGAGVAAYLILK